MTTIAPNPRTAAMTEGRRADTARRRQRVIKALNDASACGDDLNVTAIARMDRTFLYRQRDLLGQIHAMAAQPAATGTSAPSRTNPAQSSRHSDWRCATAAEQDVLCGSPAPADGRAPGWPS